MREIMSLFTFALAAACFVVFLNVVRPDAAPTVRSSSKPLRCNTEGSSAPVCRPHFEGER